MQDFEDRRLERGASRLMMRLRPLLHDPRFYAVTEELARGEKARRTRAHDEDLGIRPRVRLLRHSGFPPEFLSTLEGEFAAWQRSVGRLDNRREETRGRLSIAG